MYLQLYHYVFKSELLFLHQNQKLFAKATKYISNENDYSVPDITYYYFAIIIANSLIEFVNYKMQYYYKDVELLYLNISDLNIEIYQLSSQ